MKKTIVSVMIIFTLIFSLAGTSFGDNTIDLLEKEKAEGLLQESTATGDVDVDMEWKEDLDKAYEEKLKIEREIDYKTGEVLSILSDDDSLLSKTISVTKEDKIESMKKMIELLDKQKVDSNNIQRFTRYISKYAPYSDDNDLLLYYKNMSSNISSELKNMQIQSGTYDRNLAVQYAYDHYATGTFNTDYPDLYTNFGNNDCTNFVSQCLFEGGIPMNGSWYCYKKNNTYPAPSSVSELNYSWDLADPSPWISAVEFELKFYPIFSNETFSTSYCFCPG